MNCLVTDKVRRTVKFLCAVAKGVPIVTTDWLEKVSFLLTQMKRSRNYHTNGTFAHRGVRNHTLFCSLYFRVVKLGASSQPVCLLSKIQTRRQSSISAWRNLWRLPAVSLSYRYMSIPFISRLMRFSEWELQSVLVLCAVWYFILLTAQRWWWWKSKSSWKFISAWVNFKPWGDLISAYKQCSFCFFVVVFFNSSLWKVIWLLLFMFLLCFNVLHF